MQSEDPSELFLSEEVAEEQARIKAWAMQTEELGAISNLLDLIKRRRTGLSEAYARGLREISRAFHKIYFGDISADIWTLSLTLEQGDRDSSGTRNYVLSVGDQGVIAECCGSEYTRGEGSDSWTGASFFFSPDKTRKEGDFYSFVNEFENAIAQTEEYELNLEMNGEPPETEAEEKEAKRAMDRKGLCSRIIQRVIRGLQQMQDTSMLLSGDDSGLTNVWDEICVQQQTEESFAWSAYEETMRVLIGGALDDYSYNQLCDLWLLTNAGEDWLSEHSSDERPAPCKSDVVDFIYTALLRKAVDHSNARIRRFCDKNLGMD